MTIKHKKKLCLIDPNAPCESCEIKDDLICNIGDKSRTVRFYSSLLSLIFTSLIVLGLATYFSGLWWTIPVYIIYWGVYQLYVELIIHCPHCPYWDEDADEIVCLPNCGIKKPTWKWIGKYLKHNPKPYTFFEKAVLNIFNVFSIAFPFGVVCYSAYEYFHWSYVPAFSLFLIASVYFSYMLKTRFCAKCANFSCPLNSVSAEVVDVFNKKNAG